MTVSTITIILIVTTVITVVILITGEVLRWRDMLAD